MMQEFQPGQEHNPDGGITLDTNVSEIVPSFVPQQMGAGREFVPAVAYEFFKRGNCMKGLQCRLVAQLVEHRLLAALRLGPEYVCMYEEYVCMYVEGELSMENQFFCSGEKGKKENTQSILRDITELDAFF